MANKMTRRAALAGGVVRGFLAATQPAVKRYWDVKEQFLRNGRNPQDRAPILQVTDSTLTSHLGRMAIETRREVTWEEMLQAA